MTLTKEQFTSNYKKMKQMEDNHMNPLLAVVSMSKRQLIDAMSKDDLMSLVSKQQLRERYLKIFDRKAQALKDISKQELTEAYDRLKGKVRSSKQLEENGFVVACPHCGNHDLEKISLVMGTLDIHKIIKVENGTIYLGDVDDRDWTGEQHLECQKCSGVFAAPTKADVDSIV